MAADNAIIIGLIAANFAPKNRKQIIMSVVDQETKVYGVDNLRVIDSSIMPDILSGNLNAGTIMIAEKAADMIMGKQEDSIEAEFYN